jgi:hypothetical protein
MFKKIKSLFQKTPQHEISSFWSFRIFDLEDDRTFFLVRWGWAVYRFFKWSTWSNPRRAYFRVKHFIQRGRRGWADCDTWSLDDYLSGIMPDALRYLRYHKHGLPSDMFTPDDFDPMGGTTDTGMLRGHERWHAVLDKIIAGFEAQKKLNEGVYEEELGEYPLHKPAGISAAAWDQIRADRFLKTQELNEHYTKVFAEGMALFVKHYNSLWD